MNWSRKKCRNCPQSEPLDAQSCTGCGALFPLPVVVTDIRVPHVRWVGIGCLLAVGLCHSYFDHWSAIRPLHCESACWVR